MIRSSCIAVVAITLLAACGGAEEPGATAAAKPASGAVPAGWNALDACATVPRAAVEKAAGAAVTAADLRPGSPGGGGLAAFSTCTFTLAGGGQVMVLTRQAPHADATPEAIAAARTGGGALPPAVDVPGLGKAALWSEPTKGLQVFLDDTRYVSINAIGLPAGADAQASAVALARTLP